MASNNDIEKNSLIRNLGASEVQAGGRRRGTDKTLHVVDMDNRPVDLTESAGKIPFLIVEEMPELVDRGLIVVSDQSPQAESIKEIQVHVEPIKEKKVRVQKAKAQPVSHHEQTRSEAMSRKTIDLEYGNLKLKGVEIEEMSRGDNGALLIATKPGSPFSFEMPQGEECLITELNEKIHIYSTGLRSRIMGLDVSVFIEVSGEEP